MLTRILYSVGSFLLVATPAAAQFGVAGNRKNAVGGSFQEMNERAKKLQVGTGGGAGMGGIADMDPQLLEMMEQMGSQYDDIAKLMAELSPEELEKQMKDAMEMLQSGDLMKTVMDNLKDNQAEILETLEAMGQIDPVELAKFKTDPEYFEQKMKESFDQIGTMFNDPEMLKMAADSMAGIGDLYKDPSAMQKLMQDALGDLDDDAKIEEVRQLFLENPELMDPSMYGGVDTLEIIKDPKKWREAIKEGSKFLKEGAGVGEL